MGVLFLQSHKPLMEVKIVPIVILYNERGKHFRSVISTKS